MGAHNGIAADAVPVDVEFLTGIRNLVTQTIPYRKDYGGFRSYEDAKVEGAKCNDQAQYMGDFIAQRKFPADKMQMLVTRLEGNPEAHTVLAVDLDDDGDPYILDINTPQVLKLSQRPDLDEDVRLPWVPGSER